MTFQPIGILDRVDLMVFANCIICGKKFRKLGPYKTCGGASCRGAYRNAYNSACQQKYYQKHRTKLLLKGAAYRKKHRAEERARHQKYYREHPEKMRLKSARRQRKLSLMREILFAKFGKETINELLRGL